MVTERGSVFSCRWPWGRIVFESGSWTSDPIWGWSWIPPGPEAEVPGLAEVVDDPYPMPALLPSLKIRSIVHPDGVDFAYPLGQAWGRRLPAGTEIRFPSGPVGSAPDQNILVPEAQLGGPVLRVQQIRR